MKPTTVLPDDPALPGLRAIRAVGVAGAMLALGFDDAPVELRLRAYKPGRHATLEARAGHRHFAVKAYAQDPAPEAALYQALAAVGLASSWPGPGLPDEAGVRVPPLLAWERDLRVLVVGWLEGPTAHELLKSGQGARAGELGARWLQRAASLQVTLGPPFGAAGVLRRVGKWVGALSAADPWLGNAAAELAGMLERKKPREETVRLVHGSLHDRNLLDVGGVPGVVDWQRFGQGPAEVEAGMFLAAVSRVGLMHESLAGEAARAETAFLAGTRGLVDERALAWHRVAGLLRLADRALTHEKNGWAARARVLVGEAARVCAGLS